jgi:hypothetical protein
MRGLSNPLIDYSPQLELQPAAQGERDAIPDQGIFDEHQEMELVVALLGSVNEEQLDHVLEAIIGTAASADGKRLSYPLARAVCGVLKSIAGRALRVPASAGGATLGAPLGAQLGSGLAAVAGPALGLELEGLSLEDREFEAARQFVRFAGETASNARNADPRFDPAETARRAAFAAAQTYAPGLTIEQSELPRLQRRWMPRGNRTSSFGT